MPVLEAHDITKTFQEGRQTVTVLRGVSLSLERGEIVTLEGPDALPASRAVGWTEAARGARTGPGGTTPS